MNRQRIMLLSLLLLASLTACSPGHNGRNEIAFIRDGHLWTIDPDGTNAFEVVAQDTPVIGYSWSPNHQLLVFRTIAADFAKTSAAKQLASNPITGTIGDLPSTVNTIGLDGGSPIPIMLSSPNSQYSNPIWNPTGERLLYREESTTPPYSPLRAFWWVSQNDQPTGIAAKLLPESYSIPSVAYTGMVIGNAQLGAFTTTLAGTDRRSLIESLPGHPLPATLERLLWQPAHQQPSILYAIATAVQSAPALTVQLMLRAMDGRTTTLTTCICTQFAWSPDGHYILYSTSSNDTVVNIDDGSSFNITVESGSVPYWSPDSKFLLLDGMHSLQLVQIAEKHQQTILGNITTTQGSEAQPGINALLQPIPNSPWAADSRHFLFLTRNRLSSSNGLYVVTIDNHGRPQGMPIVVDKGNDSQPGWTYEDANTSFLY